MYTPHGNLKATFTSVDGHERIHAGCHGRTPASGANWFNDVRETMMRSISSTSSALTYEACVPWCLYRCIQEDVLCSLVNSFKFFNNTRARRIVSLLIGPVYSGITGSDCGIRSASYKIYINSLKRNQHKFEYYCTLYDSLYRFNRTIIMLT